MNDLPGPLDGHALVLADLGVLLGELPTKLAGLRVEHGRGSQVDTQFCCPRADLPFITQDRQLRDVAPQQPTGRLQDPVVIAFGQNYAFAVPTAPIPPADR